MVRERAIGALVGLAVGDALGTTVAFIPRGGFVPLADMVGGGPFGLAPGQWTDDTAMAVCLAESLLWVPTLDARDLMRRFRDWWREGVNSATGVCFDIGMTTRAAIARFERDGDPVAGDTDPRCAGNGSVMRLAPVAVRWWRDVARAEAVAQAQSRTTHGAAEAVDGCALLARSLCRLIAGEGKAALRVEEAGWVGPIQAVGRGIYAGKTADEIASTGYVTHTLEAAYWAVARSGNFEEAVLLAANLGGDADTVAAVTGQLAGALWGYGDIPLRWRRLLHEYERLVGLAMALFAAGEG